MNYSRVSLRQQSLIHIHNIYKFAATGRLSEVSSVAGEDLKNAVAAEIARYSTKKFGSTRFVASQCVED